MRFCRILSVFAVTCIVFATARGQRVGLEAETEHWWVNIGGGVAAQQDFYGTTATVTYSHLLPSPHVFGELHGLVSARILGSNNFIASDQRRLKTLTEYGVMYGIVRKSPSGFLAAAGGIGLARFSYEGGSVESISTSAVSMPLEIQAFLTPTSFFGAGVYVFLSANPERSFGGVTVCVQFGNLR